jgi:hypothetical protein
VKEWKNKRKDTPKIKGKEKEYPMHKIGLRQKKG